MSDSQAVQEGASTKRDFPPFQPGWWELPTSCCPGLPTPLREHAQNPTGCPTMPKYWTGGMVVGKGPRVCGTLQHNPVGPLAGRGSQPPAPSHVIPPALSMAGDFFCNCSQETGLGDEHLSYKLAKLVRSCHELGGGEQWPGWRGWE